MAESTKHLLWYYICSRRVINMQKLFNSIKDNFTEVWLGILLFVGIPAIGYMYFGLKAFLALTIIIQAIIFTLYLYKGNK